MKKAKITEKFFDFVNALPARNGTNRIIIHHTGGADIDASAEQIHDWHLDAGYSGIGYHFVIRKSGEIERGRPQWAVGAHAYANNYDSIGIHLSGCFSIAKPTNYQIESLALLIANLCAEYNIPIDRKHILGHREVDATDCPGTLLFNMLDTVVGKANWYRYEKPDVVDKKKVTIKILSDTPVDNATIKKVKDIFKESLCPNESMFASIEGFSGFDGKLIKLGNTGRFTETLYIEGDLK